ncbi:Six-hairpin glycosidase [Parathielavia hyrcaniae]|uniref:Six-hairpin glycosidase n=1 Tax=Parathielavia hyrcaniae TaxID=113614 RepID=A0AAN6T029_9PEZI|nr:Six-hairpin glycosidase [Parathielavia hyrcaniae]
MMYSNERPCLRVLVSLAICGSALSQAVCHTSINIGYDVNRVSGLSGSRSKSNWEWGTHAQALLELHDPNISVFNTNAFPGGQIPNKRTAATDYARSKITTSGNTLTRAGVSAGDPASLGVFAILLGRSESSTYSQAATRQVNELLNRVPRYSNGAISHRYDAVMLWSDFIYMVPPTLAYQAVAVNNPSLLREAVRQITLYREALQDRSTGLWMHIIGSRRDAGTWSTGNGWAAGGIARVLATLKHWPTSSGWTAESQRLVQYGKEIIDGAMRVGPEARSGLLKNYMTQSNSFPEAAGTAMIAASIYRFAVLAPETFATPHYLQWADARRADVVRTVRSDGRLSPVANPYAYLQNSPYSDVSPEAQDFAVFLYTAYRDCVCSGRCRR